MTNASSYASGGAAEPARRRIGCGPTVVSGVAGWPYRRLRAVGSYRFPVSAEHRVQVTAQWGWAAVPTAIEQACLVQASKVYHFRHTPQGLVGLEDGSAARESGLDARARVALEPYRRRFVAP